MKRALDKLIRIVGMAEEKISELKGISVQTSKTEKQREQRTTRKSELKIQGMW